MAMTKSRNHSVRKGAVCQVLVEDVTSNVLLVVLKDGATIYRGVLLDQSASGPYGFGLIKPCRNEEKDVEIDEMTSKFGDGGQETNKQFEESSLSLRSTYQENQVLHNKEILPSPLRDLSRSLKDKNIRKRMLRPRHVLCSKCKEFCDDTDAQESFTKLKTIKRKLEVPNSVSYPSKNLKTDAEILTVQQSKNDRPVIKISFQPPKQQSSANTSVFSSNCANSDVDELKNRSRQNSALVHSPSVLLHRIDWNRSTETQHEALSVKSKLDKEHKHRHKRKHKKHKHKASLLNGRHRDRHHKKRTKCLEAFPMKHSSSCLKIKTRPSAFPEVQSSLMSHVTRNIDDTDSHEDSSSHSLENYKLNSSNELSAVQQLDGYSDTDSTDTYDFPQSGFNSDNSDGEALTEVSRPLTMKIQTRNVFRCDIPDGRSITVGDIIWGKIHGFPAWPGRIISITIRQMDNGIPISKIAHVSWFGSRTRSHMPLRDLCPFMDDYNLKFNKKKKGPYKIAVKQAWLAAQQSLPEFQDVDIEG